MSNHIWTADGRMVEIDMERKQIHNVKNVIEPFTLFSLKDDVVPENYNDKKIIFVKPGLNKTLSNLCFYRDIYSDGTVGEFNVPPIIEISGSKCSSDNNKNSFGMRINNIRSVNDTKGTATINDKDGIKCVLNRKDINDSYLSSLYFGDCLSDPTYWSEEKDPKKINEYKKQLVKDKISNYIPQLHEEESSNSTYKPKYNAKIRTVLDLDPTFKNHIANNKDKDALSKLLYSNSCLGGTSNVNKAPKSDSIANTIKSIFSTDIDNDKVSGKEGIVVNLYGDKCPENAKSYFGIDVKYMETTDANGNIRTFKMPTQSKLQMGNNSKPQITTYEKDEKCQIDFTRINPLLKNALVGDCNNSPTALKKVKSLDITKDNNIILYEDTNFKTKQEKIHPKRPGLGSYNIQIAPPKCNYDAKNLVEFNKMVSKCGK